MTEAPLSLLPDRLGLPRGRSALSESEVTASQRARIMHAVTDEVADSGFHGTTVASITSRARVSRTSFYQVFADKEEAFAAAHLEASHRLVGRIRQRSAAIPMGAWQERIRTGVQAYLENFESAPAFAQSFVIELHGAGDRLLRQRDEVIERYAQFLITLAERSTATGALVRIPDQFEAIGAIAATEELVARELRSVPRGVAAPLGRLVEPISRIQAAVLAPNPGSVENVSDKF